jgi:carboxylesterase type B
MILANRRVGLPTLIFLLCLSYGCGNCKLGSGSKHARETRPRQTIYDDISVLKKHPCSTPDLKLKQGSVCGILETTAGGKKVNAYLGIPYAESTGGKNRWRPPIPRAPWKGTFRATQPGPSCPQAARAMNPQSEDCLSVNVWTPAEDSTTPRAVMVFIYGGSFIHGSNADPLYDGSYTSAYGNVVVVTMNYRMGALGFLAGIIDKKTGEEINGNYGILDQILALEWVRDNIGSFGGDPDNVTIYGESSGAMSVGLHMLSSPRSEHLFRAGIITSDPLGLPYRTVKESHLIAKEFASSLGCPADDIGCMRAKGPEAVLQAQRRMHSFWPAIYQGLKDVLVWAPVIDGKVLKEQPLQVVLRDGLIKPLIIGTNDNEALLFVEGVKSWLGWKTISNFDYRLAMRFIFRDREIRKKIFEKYPPDGKDNTRLISKMLTEYLFTCPSLDAASHASHDTRAYLFDHIPSFNIWGWVPACADTVCHSVELPFIFHTPQGRGYQFTSQENTLSNLMVKYWTDFAKDSSQSGFENKWPVFMPYSLRLLLVTPVNDIKAKPDLQADCKFWNEIGYNIHNSIWGIF